jgi:hypothetical protein
LKRLTSSQTPRLWQKSASIIPDSIRLEGGTIMAKGQKKNKKMTKKKPQKTLKEKRHTKREKKNDKNENILDQIN